MFSQLKANVPVIFTINNASVIDDSAILFLASQNLTQPNFGLPATWGVVFQYFSTEGAYARLISDTENAPFKLWKFRYDYISGGDVDTQMNQEFTVVRRQSDGTLVDYPLTPYEDLDQVVYTAREFRYPVVIDGDAGIRITLLAGTSVRFYFWMDKDVSLINNMDSGKPVFNYSKPFPLEAKNPYLVRIIWGEQSARIEPKK